MDLDVSTIAEAVSTADMEVIGLIDDQAVRDSFLDGTYERATFETTCFELSVTGEIPHELTGRYLRLGANPVTPPDRATFHWWQGDGMMHGVHLSNGRANWYRSRFMRTAQVAEAFGLPPLPVGEGRTLGTANTSPLVFRGKTYATQEAAAIPLRLSDELESLGGEDFGGGLTGAFSAHCKIDPRTGELFAAVYDGIGWLTHKRKPYILMISPEGKVMRETPLDLEHATMLHDCWITENFVAIADLPVRLAEELIGVAHAPLTWDPSMPSRIGLIDRRDPDAPQRWFDVMPGAVYHMLNGYEKDGKVVLEGIRYDKLFDKDDVSFLETPGYVHRWTLDLDTGQVEELDLDDCPSELCVIDQRRLGVDYRYGYWLGYDVNSRNRNGHRQLAFAFTTICKLDRETGSITRAPAIEGYQYGEMFFAPRSPEAEEDDGWLMGFRYRPGGGPTDMVILSAKDITAEPVAVIHMPVRVPQGYHSWWAPD